MINAMTPRKINRSADHRYTYDGKTYPGVTSILDVLDKSGPLMAWASRQTAEAAIANVPHLTEMLESVGPEGVVKALTARSSWKRDEAAQLGTDVHDLADRHVRGEAMADDLPDGIRERIVKYAEWWQASGWSLRASEAMVINPEMQYGGTMDLYAWDRDHKSVLADVKTGKGVYKEAILQMTAYGDASYIETEQGFFTMAPPDRYVILHVTTAGVREVEVNVGNLERLAWAAVRDLHDWVESMKGKKL